MTVEVTQLSVRPDRLVRILRQEGYCPDAPKAFGPSGLYLSLREVPGAEPFGSVIVTQSDQPGDDSEWLHASIARTDRMPDYADLVALKAAVFGDDRECYQVFPPKSRHVSIHDQALHLWGRADGRPVLPEFGTEGSI